MARQIIDTTTPQPNGKIGDTAKVAFEKTNDNFAELYDAVANIPEDVTGDIEALDVRVTANEGAISALDTRVTANEGAISALRGYIDGLRMEWVSDTSLRVTGGAAYIPGLNGILSVASPITKSGLSLSANTWYHLYLYRNGGSADIEISATEPAEPYSGVARAKSGDNTRRYIGSVKTNASSQLHKFQHFGDSITYLENTNAAPFLLLSAGTATTTTAVSAAAVAPVSARVIKATIVNASPSAYVRISNSDGPSAASGYITLAAPAGVTVTEVPVNSSQEYTYAFDAAPAPGATYHRAFGYSYER